MNAAGSLNPFENAQAELDRIASLMGLESAACRLLRSPMHEHRFVLPARMDDGRVEVFDGFRVQHNDARGPCWGGVRFHPLATFDVVRALAMAMTWKTAVVDLPLGGSMGGVVCDPRMLSLGEQERVCRGWVRRIRRSLGPWLDVPAPDVMTSARHMGWMLDEYEAIVGEHSPGSITGKSVTAGGSRGRLEATGYGLVYCLREALKELGLDPRSTSAAVQGFGTVGRHAAELYTQIGGAVRCVSTWDRRAGAAFTIRRQEGVDLDQLGSLADPFGDIDHERAAGLGYEVLDGDAWLAEEVDVLLPAALEEQITASNVGRVNERVAVLVEGANGPTTAEAERELLERGVFVVPDLLANAGGVVCSYFEQVQASANYYWRLSEVLSKLDLVLTSAFVEVSELRRAKSLTMRDAALVIAVDRVASVCRERGWV